MPALLARKPADRPPAAEVAGVLRGFSATTDDLGDLAGVEDGELRTRVVRWESPAVRCGRG